MEYEYINSWIEISQCSCDINWREANRRCVEYMQNKLSTYKQYRCTYYGKYYELAQRILSFIDCWDTSHIYCSKLRLFDVVDIFIAASLGFWYKNCEENASYLICAFCDSYFPILDNINCHTYEKFFANHHECCKKKHNRIYDISLDLTDALNKCRNIASRSYGGWKDWDALDYDPLYKRFFENPSFEFEYRKTLFESFPNYNPELLLLVRENAATAAAAGMTYYREMPVSRLVKAGWQFKNYDTLECPMCDIKVNRWSFSDDPYYIHRKFSPKCQYVRYVKMEDPDYALRIDIIDVVNYHLNKRNPMDCKEKFASDDGGGGGSPSAQKEEEEEDYYPLEYYFERIIDSYKPLKDMLEAGVISKQSMFKLLDYRFTNDELYPLFCNDSDLWINILKSSDIPERKCEKCSSLILKSNLIIDDLGYYIDSNLTKLLSEFHYNFKSISRFLTVCWSCCSKRDGEMLFCPICYNICCNVVTYSICGHVICDACDGSLIEHDTSEKCPICRSIVYSRLKLKLGSETSCQNCCAKLFTEGVERLKLNEGVILNLPCTHLFCSQECSVSYIINNDDTTEMLCFKRCGLITQQSLYIS